MSVREDGSGGGLSRRGLLAAGAAGLGTAMAPRILPAAEAIAAPAEKSRGAAVLETVTGPLRAREVRWALAHEHFFVDFNGPTSPKYMDVDWADVTGACVNNARILRTQGVDLLIDWTNMGVGRNVLLLRDVSRRTGLKIVSASGIYKSLVPPQFEKASITDLAAHFFRELTEGVDGTGIRAGWIKCATTEAGPTRGDTRIHRAAARAAKRARATISLHSPHADATRAVVRTLESEGFDLRRFVWGHAQPSPVAEHVAMARRGAMVQYDAISATTDPFFHGPTDDESMLDRIEEMIGAGFGDRVLVASDATVVVNPPAFQYDRDSSYTMRTFVPKLRARVGKTRTRMIMRDNVLRAFRRGDRVR
jgi:phosphotriesterase-related protein